jgi:hypothetical protein
VSWGLVKVLAALAVLAAMLFDGGAVLVNVVQVDEAAGDVARSAARDYAARGSPAGAEQVAMAVVADLRGAQLDDLEVDRAGLTVTVTRTAHVVLLDRLPLVADWAMASATKRASWP